MGSRGKGRGHLSDRKERLEFFFVGEMWEVERKEEDKNGMVTDFVSVLRYLYSLFNSYF